MTMPSTVMVLAALIVAPLLLFVALAVKRHLIPTEALAQLKITVLL
jgi:hypothetical protein